jgi:hypothetical protein
MILFARPQRHARRRAHSIIGVSPVFWIAAETEDRKPERQASTDKPKTQGKPKVAPRLNITPPVAGTARCLALRKDFPHERSFYLRAAYERDNL